MAGFSPRERRELQVLLAIFAVVTVWSAIRPYDRADYVVELVTPVGGAILLVVTARWTRSAASSRCCCSQACTIGNWHRRRRGSLVFLHSLFSIPYSP
jgi:hypothetical protein